MSYVMVFFAGMAFASGSDLVGVVFLALAVANA